MTDLQKQKPYRNKEILSLAKECPHCMNCGNVNDDTIVAAHYCGIRQHALDKGIGQKPTDTATAYLCQECHEDFDQYKTGEDEIKRSERFLFAIVKSTDWRNKYLEKDSYDRWCEGL